MILIPPIPMPHIDVRFVEFPFWAQWDFWVSFFTLWLAAMTGWLAWETRGLRKDSARSIKAAEQGASSAVQGVAVSQESVRRTLRAYVTLAALEIAEFDILLG